MDEPRRLSPLAGVGEERGKDVELAALPPLGKLSVRATPEIFAGTAMLTLPERPLRSATSESGRVLRLGPDEWLVVTIEGRQETLAGELRAALADQFVAIVDISERMCSIELAGLGAATVLAAGCPLDLHERVAPPGLATRTLVGKCEVVLERLETAQFVLHVNRSFAAYLWLFLKESAGIGRGP